MDTKGFYFGRLRAIPPPETTDEWEAFAGACGTAMECEIGTEACVGGVIKRCSTPSNPCLYSISTGQSC